MSKTPLITSRTDWTIPLIEEVWDHIEDVAVNDLGLTYYQPQIEIVSAEQMLDAYSSIGYPVNYNHWSFGKDFLVNQENYRKGMMNLTGRVPARGGIHRCWIRQQRLRLNPHRLRTRFRLF